MTEKELVVIFFDMFDIFIIKNFVKLIFVIFTMDSKIQLVGGPRILYVYRTF